MGSGSDSQTRLPNSHHLLQDYHNRGGKAEPWTPPEIRTERSGPLVDPDRLHDLTESLKAIADEGRAEREGAKPKDVVGMPGTWKMVPRPLGDPKEPGDLASYVTVTAVLIGGEKDGKEIQIAADLCLESPTLRIERDTWVARQSNGEVAVVQGEDRRATDWLSFLADIYTQAEKPTGERIAYTFTKTVKVTRCSATTKKGVRCRHAARDESSFCSTHAG